MIISVEGLKGTGKSLLVEKLKGCVEMEVLPKFTRGFAAYPVWLEEIKQGYQQPFVDECFGFRWCANFFASLAEYQEDKVVLVEKGLISLGCSGLFGHLMYSHLPYVQYKVQMASVFDQYVAKYQPYVAQTMFVVVHADEGNMKHRIHARKRLVPSEKVFLDHLDEYQELQAMSVARVKQESTMVLELPNNDKNDLEMLIRVVQKVIK